MWYYRWAVDETQRSWAVHQKIDDEGREEQGCEQSEPMTQITHIKNPKGRRYTRGRFHLHCPLYNALRWRHTSFCKKMKLTHSTKKAPAADISLVGP